MTSCLATSVLFEILGLLLAPQFAIRIELPHFDLLLVILFHFFGSLVGIDSLSEILEGLEILSDLGCTGHKVALAPAGGLHHGHLLFHVLYVHQRRNWLIICFWAILK